MAREASMPGCRRAVSRPVDITTCAQRRTSGPRAIRSGWGAERAQELPDEGRAASVRSERTLDRHQTADLHDVGRPFGHDGANRPTPPMA